MPNSTHLDTAHEDVLRVLDSPDLIPPRGHYSYVAVHRGTAHLSGQLPVDEHGTPLTDQPFDAQVQQVLHNLDLALAAADTDRDHLISLTAYVTDIEQWPAFDAAYAQWIGAHRPARAVAGVSQLHYGAAVEVHAVAALP